MNIQHHHEKVMLQGQAGQLEALYQEGKADKPAIAVCHPHPVYGGTMRNKVVYWMSRAFEDMGYTVLRFNFRGVEKSEGSWDEGKGEADDVRTAMDWLADKHPDSPLYLAGFSFGCYAGLQAAREDSRIQRLLMVAPAVNLWSFAFMQGDTRPLIIIQGTKDEIVPFVDVETWVKSLGHVQFKQLDGAGHFFPKHMDELKQLCALIDEGSDEGNR
ncbi:MAG: alpha/beta fold hydrolase [Mariprofundaceae bacterium]|nr:alpha/beta fold hydrolase [Mariprofundaceae bacterium]